MLILINLLNQYDKEKPLVCTSRQIFKNPNMKEIMSHTRQCESTASSPISFAREAKVKATSGAVRAPSPGIHRAPYNSSKSSNNPNSIEILHCTCIILIFLC